VEKGFAGVAYMCRSSCILLFFLVLELFFGQLSFGEGAHREGLQLLFAYPLKTRPKNVRLVFPATQDTFTFKVADAAAESLLLFPCLLIFSTQYAHYQQIRK